MGRRERGKEGWREGGKEKRNGDNDDGEVGLLLCCYFLLACLLQQMRQQ